MRIRMQYDHLVVAVLLLAVSAAGRACGSVLLRFLLRPWSCSSSSRSFLQTHHMTLPTHPFNITAALFIESGIPPLSTNAFRGSNQEQQQAAGVLRVAG